MLLRASGARGRAIVGAVALVATMVASPLASAGERPSNRMAGRTITLRFFSQVVSLTWTGADGKIIQQRPAPHAGDQLEVSETYFAGTSRKHAKHWSVTSHTVCVFKATGAAICDGQAAVGGNQMVFVRTAVDASGGGDTLIRGGTGRYAGATGTENSSAAGGANNTDVVMVVHLRT
jgi:hypothetical protein